MHPVSTPLIEIPSVARLTSTTSFVVMYFINTNPWECRQILVLDVYGNPNDMLFNGYNYLLYSELLMYFFFDTNIIKYIYHIFLRRYF